MKDLWVLKDVKYLGISNTIEHQWIKHRLEDNDELFEKVNVRGTICLDKPANQDAEAHLKEQLKDFIPALVIEQAKEIGRLNDIINGMSGEVRNHKKDKKDMNETIATLAENRLVLQNEKEAKKEEIRILKEKVDSAVAVNDNLSRLIIEKADKHAKELESAQKDKEAVQKKLAELEKFSGGKVVK